MLTDCARRLGSQSCRVNDQTGVNSSMFHPGRISVKRCSSLAYSWMSILASISPVPLPFPFPRDDLSASARASSALTGRQRPLLREALLLTHGRYWGVAVTHNPTPLGTDNVGLNHVFAPRAISRRETHRQPTQSHRGRPSFSFTLRVAWIWAHVVSVSDEQEQAPFAANRRRRMRFSSLSGDR